MKSLKSIIQDYIYIRLENPLKTWRKAKECFRKPSAKIHFFTNIHHNCPYASIYNVPKVLCIECEDVQWKWKWGDVRHERDPYIWICFFRTFGFSINYKIFYRNELGKKEDGGIYYWEYLLQYLYVNNKTLKAPDAWSSDSKLYQISNSEVNEAGEEIKKNVPYRTIVPTQLFSLNNKGFKKLQERYEQRRNTKSHK